MTARGQRWVRLALTKTLATKGVRLRSRTWMSLLDGGRIDAVLSGELDLEGLVELCVRQQTSTNASPVARREVVREVEDDRDRARVLAQLLARKVVRCCDVDSFRAEALDGALLLPKHMARWISEQRQHEGAPSSRYVAIPIASVEAPDWLTGRDTAGYAEWLAQQARRIAADSTSELPSTALRGSMVLDYEMTAGKLAHLPIRSDGTLARLKTLVSGDEGVCALSGWTEAAAVTFVLCGKIPTPRAATVTVRHAAYPAATQLDLLVSTNLRGPELAQLYQQVRASQRGIYERLISDKLLVLAVFVDEHKDSGLSWRELRRQWNELHPQWRYETARDQKALVFSTDARETWSRITGEDWHDLPTERLRSYGDTHPRDYKPGRSQPGRAPSPTLREKRIALAEFIDVLKDEDLSWQQLRERWNESHPEWSYETASKPRDDERFPTDARRAWSRVTGKPWRDLHDKRRLRFSSQPRIPTA